ncbi:type II toxin-antitoxin system VapC family toxin [Phyllobacterium chamaecytisi]|uniref:type II toxin-antitoxin system VapC family toxin n=1 Tax=Phyllobacterium chamaecytisi TaxID=2876082 RepID=UPI001CC963CB|nr:type II toxin-antitoxin system VapC family toxin [Phyllobacterium sp. KW56]MBZ9604391.1 type II toxin-antitoxin system VapC family toxin [Phyllobacterium sp. KW56]
MFVDASVMVAILLKEPGAETYAGHLEDTDSQLITSVIAVWETTAALFGKKGIAMSQAQSLVTAFINETSIEVVAISNDDLSFALQAFERYGRHQYPADNRNSALNLADCFHYASAKSHRAPILTKDAGFALTDLEAIGPAKDQ